MTAWSIDRKCEKVGNRMENKKIMDAFRRYVGKNNGNAYGWLITWIISVLFLLYAGIKKTGAPIDKAYYAGVLAFLLADVTAYARRYTKFYFADKTTKEMEGMKVFLQNDLSDLLGTISFDPFTYFALLGKRLFPLQLCSAFVFILAGVFHFLTMRDALAVAAAYVLIPGITLAIRALEFHRSMTRGKGIGWHFLAGVGETICSMARVIMVGMAFVCLMFWLIESFGIKPVMAEVDENVAVRMCGGSMIAFVCSICTSVFLSFFASGMYHDANFSVWKRWRMRIVLTLTVILTLSTGYCCYGLRNEHVRLMEDSITVRRGGKDKVYGLNKITQYRIFCQEDAIQMEVTFDDGEEVRLFSGISEETKTWSQKFYGDAVYAAYLVDRLGERGVVGKLEDQGKIEENMKDYDEELKEGFRHIVEVIGRP